MQKEENKLPALFMSPYCICFLKNKATKDLILAFLAKILKSFCPYALANLKHCYLKHLIAAPISVVKQKSTD